MVGLVEEKKEEKKEVYEVVQIPSDFNVGILNTRTQEVVCAGPKELEGVMQGMKLILNRQEYMIKVLG